MHQSWRQGASLIHGVLLAGLLLAGGGRVLCGATARKGVARRFRQPAVSLHRPARRQCILGSHARDGLRRRPESHRRIPVGGGSLRSSSRAHGEVLQQKVDVLVTVATVRRGRRQECDEHGAHRWHRHGRSGAHRRRRTASPGPGGNLTGLSMGWGDGMAGKWLELLQEAVPRLSTVGRGCESGQPAWCKIS